MSQSGHLWMCFGGTEIVSACTTQNLQANGHGLEGISCFQCNCCEDLNRALYGGIGGQSIAQAPWYDPQEPLSTEFAGLLVTEITGLAPGAFTRPVSESVGPGATLGQFKQLAPVITVTGILLGSCCGVDYGLSWLRSALRGSCDSSKLCAGDDLQFLSCEPKTPDLDCLTEQEAEDFDYEAWLTPYIRSLRNVALVAGPEITNRIPRGCADCHECSMVEVQFTLAAGDPRVYREPIVLADLGVFEDDPENLKCIEWVPAGSGLSCGCTDAVDCATDPDCQDVKPPAMGSLTATCGKACLQNDRVRSCFEVPEGTFPVNGNGTLRILIDSGGAPMRNVQIIGWHNPLGLSVDDLSDCDACFGINASYLAPSSQLIIDGAARTSMIECPGGKPVRANPFLSSDGSPVATYPEFSGCAEGAYTVCVYADKPVSPLAKIHVEAIGFEG